MIRVGLPYPSTNSGKRSYWRNLLNGIRSLPERQIEPVILMGKRTKDDFSQDYPHVRLIRSRFLDPDTPWYASRNRLQTRYRFDVVLEWVCLVHRIRVLSHFGYLRPRSRVRTLGWIYDFQHKHLPENFNAEELQARDRAFTELCRYCDLVAVSSEDAKRDLAKFFPEGLPKTRVLRFVGATNSDSSLPTVTELAATYHLPERFFALPNQFWIHKNHGLVVDALRILRERGRSHYVVATGSERDPRDPTYFGRFQDKVRQAGLSKQFLILGVIPHRDVLGVINASVALINPSFFEGWSTSVEEGKSLGKRVLLSSIGVHREQTPDRGSLFDPKDPVVLADLMAQAWDDFDPAIERAESAKAKERFRIRLLEYGRVYQAVVLEAANTAR